MELWERRRSSRTIYEGKILRLEVWEMELPEGRSAVREVVLHRGSVGLVPLLDDGRVLLVRQYRASVGRVLLEIPAGTRDPGEEDWEAIAQRELQEEVGMRAGRLERLGTIYPSPGFLREEVILFLARDLTPSRRAMDEDERIEVVPLPLAEAVERVLAGEIVDAKTCAALLWTARRLGI